MTVIRIGFTLARTTCISPMFSNTHKLQPKLCIIANTMAFRKLSTVELTKNICLITENKLTAKVINMELVPPQDKPLVVMLSWMLARKKHVNKYAQMYVDRGIDVLNINVTPWQLLWPTKGTQLVASDILKFIDTNYKQSPLLLHGFSVGGYVWGEVLVKMAMDLTRYKPILDRFIGQVWDSLADITEIPIGVPTAVFPNNVMLQNALKQYIIYHMKTFDKVATQHYLRSSQMFHTTIVRAPALFFLSKTDPIGAERSNLRARDTWESMGMQVYWKCWDRSPHVGHYAKHPTEYVSELNMFLDKVMHTRRQQEMQAKL